MKKAPLLVQMRSDMVVLNKIYTRTGDAGQTALGNGARVDKHSARVTAYGTVDELNATLGLARLKLKRAKGRVSEGDGALRAKVLTSLPYHPTGAQERAIAEIAADMAQPVKMNRLLQGDVGAGGCG